MGVSSGLAMYGETTTSSLAIDINAYAGLVKRIAQHLLARMPSSVQLDDLIQSGMIGLLEASRKYDPSQGASFETYAGIRIRGSILDEIRRGDWAPRSVHRNSRRINQAMLAVENRSGCDATDGEMAAELGVDLVEYHRMSQDTMGTKLFSLEETFGDEDDRVEIRSHDDAGFTPPHEEFQRDSLKKSLVDGISKLPERERLVLALYYDEELNLKEIGEVLGVSESRVSQIHSQAALRLRTKLSDWQQ